ncbi:MAG TPA: hypothetical protein VNM69_16245 [Bacillus sp. (in: firmicutes)]|uniref:hypothetical protein n=1 Tax=Bacillus litorisediminis TaxID=2922713 RepID=UPI001FAF85C3|nr:hypothetical protein [Bacillus litorisediminis]HWO77416.1 hypothetical protein [Bacillus sp. (in: firmicutes)]
MSQDGKNIHRKKPGIKDYMDSEQIEDHLNSDNAFSDKGLNNARLTNEAVKNRNQ